MPSTFLPLVSNQAPAETSWQTTREELLDLLITHPEQHRRHIIIDEILMRVAQFRAQDMAERNYFGHTDPDGYGPNHHARAAGFRLPDYYGREDAANNIESIMAGSYGSVEEDWQRWLLSPSHRPHLLGLDPFYAAQVCVGVGFFSLAGSRYTEYKCVLSAPTPGLL